VRIESAASERLASAISIPRNFGYATHAHEEVQFDDTHVRHISCFEIGDHEA